MQLSAHDIGVLYTATALGGVVFLVWLGFQIFRLLRSPGEVVKPPEE